MREKSHINKITIPTYIKELYGLSDNIFFHHLKLEIEDLRFENNILIYKITNILESQIKDSFGKVLSEEFQTFAKNYILPKTALNCELREIIPKELIESMINRWRSSKENTLQ
jgi:hypothetical protein